MGYSILMQWTIPAPAQGQQRMSIQDLVLSRILEHYNIAHPMSSQIHFRTFRATFPPSRSASAPTAAGGSGTGMSTDGAQGKLRNLTSVTYSPPMRASAREALTNVVRDNVAYLFLDDRSMPVPPRRVGEGEGKAANGNGNGAAQAGDKEKEKEKDSKEKDAPKKDDKDEGSLEADGFEIVDGKKNGDKDKDGKADDSAMDVDGAPAGALTDTAATALPRAVSKYKIMAVKPANTVVTLLQSLLSPFVLGFNKSARAAASTTAQVASPTTLSGTLFSIHTLTFPSAPPPAPSISLNVHMLSKDARETIFLDAEWESALDMETARAVLREFLLGCLPVDVQGDVRFSYWEDSGAPGATADVGDPAGWMGVERMRRITFLLAKALREGQHI